MQLRKCHLFMLALVVSNLFLLWYMTHVEEQKVVIPDRGQADVTIIIPEFEHFDNDIEETVRSAASLYSRATILVLSDTVPYPFLHLPAKLAKFVIPASNPTMPNYQSNPFYFIKTDYILVLPDGVRLKDEGVLEDLVWKLKETANQNVLVVPITSQLCTSIEVNLKLWSLRYAYVEADKNLCEALAGDVLILFHKNIVQNFTEIFKPPFYESFYIQAKLRNINLNVVSNEYVYPGKILFANRHYKWKHDRNVKSKKVALYKRFGIKRVVNQEGVEKYHGCTKSTQRCFPTVLNVPYYLYEGRWTPPCCLNALRETARHVFSMLEGYGLNYWLEGGSLLGAARSGDIIPWDYDVDIGMFMNEVTNKSRFLANIWNSQKLLDGKGFVWERAREGDFIRVQYSESNHLHVDIFPFYEKNGVMTKDTWFKSHRQDMEFPAHFLKPLKRMPFIGIMALVPNNYEKFLELKFGKGVIDNPQYPFPEKLLGLSV